MARLSYYGPWKWELLRPDTQQASGSVTIATEGHILASPWQLHGVLQCKIEFDSRNVLAMSLIVLTKL